MTLPPPSAEFDRLHLEIEEAANDTVRLRRLRREVRGCAELSDSERNWLTTLTGQYEHGCFPPEVELDEVR